MSLKVQRNALRSLLDERSPADAMAAYYAYYHDADRTNLITQPRNPGAEGAKGYIAISRTGIDLFRPFLTMRLPIKDYEISMRLLRQALPPKAEAFIGCPIHYGPLLGSFCDFISEQQLALYSISKRNYEPVVNVLVSREDQNGSARFVIKKAINGKRTAVAAAGLNWESPNFAEVAVRTWSEYRRQGLGKSVVSAIVNHILATGRTPIYAVNVNNVASIALAEQLGFRDTGYRQLMLEVVAR
ncbi:MAG: GNAT family N-acetyltransferase [Chloroflexota bacterium]